MSISFFEPHSALKPYIQSYAHIQLLPKDTKNPLQFDFYPHGFPALIYNLNKVIKVKESGTPNYIEATLMFNGQYDRYSSYECSSAHFVIINFKPFGAYFLLGIPQHHLANTKIEILDLFPRMTSLYNQLEDYHDDIPNIINTLESWLLQKIPFHVDKKLERFQFAEYLIRSHSGRLPISELSEKMGMSISSLEEHFKEKVGLSPKLYSRIVRFNHCMDYIKGKNSKSWSEIVYEFDYFDQIHFIREFKKFYGYTPTQIELSKWNISKLITL